MAHKLSFFFSLCLIFLGMNSCSTISEYGDAIMSNIPVVNNFTSGKYCTVRINSTKCTNNGAPFYALVKPTDFSSFLSDDYPKISNLVMNPPKDEEGLEVFCIVPGKDQSISIEACEADSLGVYFLFTNPGPIWKQIFELQEGCTSIKIKLDGNEIVSVGN